ncbi:hypothetical protein FB599_2879 [Herbaspirillum sp. SJZ130]|nr:hypothetical protein FB599_2879 [Herbaspirillum sp. SJZ130]TQK09888.1 hypothetical protein FB598_2883 [Herbaspirillum sp. SJZ106]
MSRQGKDRKHSVSVSGPWQPVPLSFLRSRACSSLSPHAAKLLLDCLAILGPNATRNGDICLAPKIMEPRGWTSRKTLGEAVKELEAAKLLSKTRQGTRLDCSLFALTLYPLNCDLRKLDVRPGSYSTNDWTTITEGLDSPPTDESPARWNRVRKMKIEAPPGNKTINSRSIAEQTLERC